MGRPVKKFHDFVGQKRVINFLRKIIVGAKTLGQSCPPLLLKAPTGCGKSSLAKTVALEYESNFHLLLAGQEVQAIDICQMLSRLEFGDVFAIDEAHSLSSDSQQILYLALDEQRIPVISDGKIDRSQYVSIAEFCLVLATNEPGSLKRALANRLHHVELEPYSLEELKAIAETIAEKRNFHITPQSARRLVEVAQGSPRNVYKLVELLRLFNPKVSHFTETHVVELLNGQGIDQKGLTPKQRQYLITLINSPLGICTLGRLSVALGYDIFAIKRDVEPYLIEQRWVDPNSSRGRKLTDEGRDLTKQILADELLNPFSLTLK
ncbi:MAG: AAA family ATPase [Blastocatellia bacterium]